MKIEKEKEVLRLKAVFDKETNGGMRRFNLLKDESKGWVGTIYCPKGVEPPGEVTVKLFDEGHEKFDEYTEKLEEKKRR